MRKKKLLVGIMSVALLLCTASSVFAAAGSGENYTPVAGRSMTFNKYFVLDNDASVPALTFTYKIEGLARNIDAISPTTTSSGTVEILAPIAANGVSGTATVGSAAFTAGETASSTVASGDNVTLDAGKKYAKKPVTVNFSAVSFSEPGIYRWLLTENEITGAKGITYDTQPGYGGESDRIRAIDVYVTDDGPGTLVISQYVLRGNQDATVRAGINMGSADVNDPGDELDDKSDGFVNELSTKNLKFGKEIEGNQGEKDKYFKFTLEITGAQASTAYTVDTTGATGTPQTVNAATDSNYANKTNPTTITTDANGSATVNYYLMDGQYVTVKGLPKGTAYRLTEDAEDYKSTAGTSAVAVPATGTQDAKVYNDATSGTIGDANIYTGYTNTRGGIIPTGFLIPAGLGIALLVGGTAMAGIKLGRRRRDDE